MPIESLKIIGLDLQAWKKIGSTFLRDFPTPSVLKKVKQRCTMFDCKIFSMQKRPMMKKHCCMLRLSVLSISDEQDAKVVELIDLKVFNMAQEAATMKHGIGIRTINPIDPY